MAYTTPAQSRAIIVNAADSQALSFTSTPGVGSLILVAISSWQGDLGTSAVSDNQSNTYTRVPKSEWDTDADVALFWAVATNSSGTFTITVNPTGSSCDFTFCIIEFQGNASSPYDTAVTATGSTLNVSTGNITPGQNNCLWVAVMAHTGTDRTINPVNGTQIYENEGGSSNMPLSVTYKVQTTATAEAATWTLGSDAGWGALVASFKPSSGGTALTIANATQAQTADNLTVTYHASSTVSLSIADAAQAQTAEALALTQHNVLTVASAAQAQTAENAALTQHNILTIASATQAQAADNLTVTYHASSTVSLSIADAAQAQTADNLTLTQHHTLAIANADQAQTAGEPALTQHNALAIANAVQIQTAGELALIQHNTLAIANATHSQTADGISCTQHQILVIADANQSQAADNLTLVHHRVTTVTPDWRIYRVEAENRTYLIEAEDRKIPIAAENRTYPIEPENRTLAIQAEDRTYRVERTGYEDD